MLGSLLLGQLAAANELIDERVILREARQRTIAKQICAAVPDMCDCNVRIVDVGSGQRRAHPGPLMLGARELVDPAIGFPRPLGKALLGRPGIAAIPA